ncbi:oligopeptide transporter [Pholiota molesta]|nr:oligopeptide transporter [Pholiota molesta]
MSEVLDYKPGEEHLSAEKDSSLEGGRYEKPREETFDDHDVTKPFPIDPDAPEETHQLTVRAIVVGCALGAVVGASNIYLGLKTGFTFGPQLFGAILGYAILKAFSKALPESGILSVFGGPFGPKENSAGGLGILFVSAIPAMYHIGKLIALTTCAGFFGVFFVIPLRKYYIVHQKLTFPTPAATAYTIRSLHSGVAGAIAAKKKALALLYTFIVVFIFKVMTGMISLENYGWLIEFTPAFFGAGMLWHSICYLSLLIAKNEIVGGSILAWGIRPALYAEHPSPRYWLLWPGVLIMLLYSFADVALTMIPLVKQLKGASFSPRAWFQPRSLDEEDEDQTPVEDRVPTSWWTIGLFLSIVMSCAILATQFHMNVGEAILALLLGFVFSFIGVQSSGYTDASQLVFGGISKGAGITQQPAQRLNLIGGVIAAGSAAQAGDMTGDLKTGYLLRAKPRNQFVAQLCGSVVSIFLTSGLFILFTKASPASCELAVGDDSFATCTYGAPSVAAWSAVAIAVTAPKLPIALGLLSVATLLVRNAIGLAFVTPQVYYSIAMAVGSTFNFIWQIRNPGSFDMYMFAVAAGMLAGEGLGGVFQALLAVVGVDGSKFGTSVGCPGMEFCG